MEVKTEVLNITGMMCGGCEETVTKALQAIDGVLQTKVSHESGTAEVEFDSSKTNLLFIQMTINSTPYKVKA